MTLMIFVVACYTICSLSDKYAVSVGKMNGHQLTFFMAACTALFMLPCLPFLDCRMSLTWQAGLAIVLLALSKFLEFYMSAMILKEMTAFELKAWQGVLIFISYFVDVRQGKPFLWSCLVCIVLTVVGLIVIARSEKQVKVHYGKIFLPLTAYLVARFGYGYVVQKGSAYISSTMMLFLALVLLSIVLFPLAKPIATIREKKKASAVVALTKIPNVAGLLGENAIVSASLVNGSFISPMVLVALFFVGIVRGEQSSGWNKVGSIVCAVGIIAFQLFQAFF